MPCYYPLTAYQAVTGEVTFAAKSGQDIRRELSLPCGQCIGCRLERSRQWAIRIMHESQMHEFSSFITLTYDDDHCPNSLDYDHFQRFMKRLRKRFGPVRFFMAGEYGEQFGRPHFHSAIFGTSFPDRAYHARLDSGCNIYTSETLNALWPYGYSSVGDLTFESAAYVARYICKKVTGANADDHYTCVDPDTGEVVKRTPEFCHMSLKPGIGTAWYHKFKDDVFPRDEVVMRGIKMRPPKFYTKLLEKEESPHVDDVQLERYKRALMHSAENSEKRLAVREQVAKARLTTLKRKLT